MCSASLYKNISRRERGRICPHRSTGRHARSNTHRRVFHHQALSRINLQMRCRGQVHVWKRFATRHFMAAKDAAFKELSKTHALQHHFDFVAVCARSHSDAAFAALVHMAHSIVNAVNGCDLVF